jgi:chromate transporter
MVPRRDHGNAQLADQQGEVMTDVAATRKAGADVPEHGVSFGEALRVWTRVALLSFGGPAAQIAVMHRILVDEKRWVSESRFLYALNYCMLLPGPEAKQLAIYIGWLMHRTLGGIVAGCLFVVPGVITIMALSYVYALYGNVPAVYALFFGLKAAVLAIVVEAVVRIGRRALKNGVLRLMAAIAFVAIFFVAVPFPVIVLGAAAIGYVGTASGTEVFKSGGHGPSGKSDDRPSLLGDELPDHARPSMSRALSVAAVWLALWLVPVIVIVAAFGFDDVFSQIAIFFSKMAVVTFGGAYAVLSYVAQGAVEQYHWLKPGEMLDGLGMAETTPGPLIMVLQFVGFMAAFRDPGSISPIAAATLGGLLATWVTFTPCFLWIFLGAPFVEKMRGNKALNGAMSAITAAVVGVVLNLAIWFAIHTLFTGTVPVRWALLKFDAPDIATLNPWALLLAAAAAISIFRFKVGMIPTLLACCVAGVVLHLAGLV